MSDSLFKGDRNSPLRDSGIGGLKSNDDLSRQAAETLRQMQREDQREEDERRRREGEAAPRRSLDDFDLRRDTLPPVQQPTADAGTGRSVQRGPHLSDVFTLWRGNHKYLLGESESLSTDMWGYLIGIGFTAAFYVILMTSSSASRSVRNTGVPSFVYAFIIIFGALLTVLMVRSIMDARYYLRNGTLLLGRLDSVDGRWVVTGSGKNRSRKYKVTVAYSVTLPDGRVVSKTQTHTRGDLARGGLPAQGTRIAVLAVDSDKVRLL